MSVFSDTTRAASMRDAIERALRQVAAKPGAPPITVQGWGERVGDAELHVDVDGKRRVLEVSEAFLEDEPDDAALRRVTLAATHLVEGAAPRVQLRHGGVFAAWSLSRERA
jgi:hypothetical protein